MKIIKIIKKNILEKRDRVFGVNIVYRSKFLTYNYSFSNSVNCT